MVMKDVVSNLKSISVFERFPYFQMVQFEAHLNQVLSRKLF
jgi:hypothetical protein